MYRDGLGVEKNLPKSLECYEIAAENGDKLALLRLAFMYYHGTDGVKKDRKRSFSYFQIAKEYGDETAQLHLSYMRHQKNGDLII